MVWAGSRFLEQAWPTWDVILSAHSGTSASILVTASAIQSVENRVFLVGPGRRKIYTGQEGENNQLRCLSKTPDRSWTFSPSVPTTLIIHHLSELNHVCSGRACLKKDVSVLLSTHQYTARHSDHGYAQTRRHPIELECK